MPKRSFSFLSLPCVIPGEEIHTVEKYLVPDALLTYILFSPYIDTPCHFRVFERSISHAFETEGQAPIESRSVRDIYYAGLQKWHREFQLALRINQCFMSTKPAEVVINSLRLICEKINEGSSTLQEFMTGKQTGEKNTAIVMNEVSRLLAYFRREHPIVIFELFGYLFETVSEIQKDPFSD